MRVYKLKPVEQRPRRRNLTREALDAIPLWVELGARPAEIAEALDMTVASLGVVCSRRNISLRPSGSMLLDALTPAQWGALQREAVRRGLPIGRLVARTIAAVVDHGLFAAVLGDYDSGETENRAAP